MAAKGAAKGTLNAQNLEALGRPGWRSY